MNDWLTVDDLATLLRTTPRYVREQVRPGGMRPWPCRRLGGRIRFSPADVLDIEAIVAQPARGRRAS